MDGSNLVDVCSEEETDSDHGGCIRTGRSTSAWMLWWRHGNRSKALVDFGCNRRSVASISTAHSELAALKDGWTRSLFPATGAWEQVFSRSIYARSLIDRDAARKAVAKGLSLALRYLRKSHRISIAGLHDMAKFVDLMRVDSAKNSSDILTKLMNHEALVRHLFTLGVYALTWQRTGGKARTTKHEQDHVLKRALTARLQRLVADEAVL